MAILSLMSSVLDWEENMSNLDTFQVDVTQINFAQKRVLWVKNTDFWGFAFS